MSSALNATRALPSRDPVRPSARVLRRPVELVVNANASGVGGPEEVAARATHALRAAGAAVQTHLTADERELAAAVRAAEGSRLVLVGGDGTVHALANLDLPELPDAALRIFPHGFRMIGPGFGGHHPRICADADQAHGRPRRA